MEIIANDQGNHITTLYVAFTNEERLIGDAAKNRLRPPYGTVYDVKRSSAASSPTRRFSATRRWSISRSSTTPAQSLGMSVSLCVPLRPVPCQQRLLVLHLQHFTMHAPPPPTPAPTVPAPSHQAPMTHSPTASAPTAPTPTTHASSYYSSHASSHASSSISLRYGCWNCFVLCHVTYSRKNENT